MKRVSLITLAVALAFTWAGCRKSEEPGKVAKPKTSAPTGPTELVLKWPVGRRVVQSLELKQNNEISVPGMPAAMKQVLNLGQDYALNVLKEREGGGREVELEFLATRLAITMGTNTMLDYDSARDTMQDAASPVAPVFEKINGSKILYLLNASNQVESIQGLDALQQGLAEVAGNDPMGMIKSLVTEDYFKQLIDASHNLPGHPVQPGDSWPVKLDVSMGGMGAIATEYTYTFKNWEQHDGRYCALIAIDGTLKSKPGQASKVPGMKISVQDGKSSGSTWFDPEKGMFVETTLNQDMKMNIEMPARGTGNAAASQGRVITNVMSQLITVKVKG